MSYCTRIDRLGHRGDGIAPGPDGRPIYVPTGLPGEEVTGELSGDRLEAVRILTPSPDRVRPPCAHFKSCGGCSLQHASDGFLRDWKLQVVRDALAAHDLSANITALTTSPANSRRRATLSGKRTKKGAIVGLHGRASGSIVEIANCRLLHPDLIAAIPALREITVLGASRKGEVSLALTRSGAGIDLSVTQGKPLEAAQSMQLAALAKRYGLARISWDGDLVVERRAPVQMLGVARVTPPPGAFLQATDDGQAALVAAVSGALVGAKNIVDLFAGCGTFSLLLAENAQVRAVEGDGEMLAALDAGWRHAQGLKTVSTEVRDLFRRPLMPDDLAPYDAAVIDPPRAGAQAQVAQIAGSALARIVAVSCNPATFARDARVLVDAGFALGPVGVVDQFRWSPHVELVAAFSR
jgi:23S rRNA (uracil1939-C5)-methyltransferase